LVPGDGGCYYLPRIVGVAQALRLLCTGEFVDAPEALAIGLVSKMVPDEQLALAVTTLANDLAAQPPIAVQMIKRSIYLGLSQDLRTSLDAIASHLAVVTSTADSAESLAAFTQRRPGNYAGR
jgi:enoyl-CoA hydratase/carnithine racemase